MKKLNLLFTALLLMCCVGTAKAVEVTIDGIKYDVITNTKQATVISGDTKYSGDIVVPSEITYNNVTYSVTSIGNEAFYWCSGLTSITIPNSVTSIGERAFFLCYGLTSVTIGNSVTSIGDAAFYDCSGLTSITIPNSVTSIGNKAFEDCYRLTSITIPNSVTSIGYNAFSGCYRLTSITIPNSVTSIGSYAFSGCSGLTNITIPNSVTSIGSSAFGRCDGLTSITVATDNTKYDSRNNCNAIIETKSNTLIASCKNSVIPNSVTSIGNYAFSGCTGLTSITIPNSVTSIGEYAFSNCTGLTSITIPNSVTSIGSFAFNGCDGLTSITVATDNAKYDSRDNSNAIIETTTNTLVVGCKNTIIPNSVTSIGSYAFYNCSGLTSIVIPNSVTSIGKNAFYECTGLKTVYNFSNLTITKGSSNYGYVAYNADKVYVKGYYLISKVNDVNTLVEYLGNDTEITLPADYYGESYVIGSSAFKDCSRLTSITIGNSVTSIDQNAFKGCSRLTSITIGNSVTSIGQNAFKGCSRLTSITIPNSVTSIGNYAFHGCTSLKELRIEDGTNTLSLGFNYNNSSGIGQGLFYDCPLKKLYLGRNLSYKSDKSHGYSPFYGKDRLTSVTVGNSVTRIGNYAFENCGLTSVVIPDSVTSIGNYAFSGCDLTSITIPNSVTSIGNYAFSTCDFTSITIPNSVTSIGKNAFYCCTGLTSITIGNSVTSIGSEAFSGCSNLKTVYNYSNLTFTKGSTDYGYVAYYADKVINAPNASIEGDFVFGKPNGVNTLVLYLGNDTEIVLPENYKGKNYAIGAEVFKGKTSITSVVIPNSVTSIGDYTFSGCAGLTNITIPNSVTSIGTYAFSACNNLESLYIGNSIQKIGDYAFYGCNNLFDIKVANKKVITISYNVFSVDSYNNAVLYVPTGRSTFYKNTAPWSNFIVIEEFDFDNIEITGITLNKSTVTITEGETETLVATIIPSNATDKTITWKTSNSAVATVSNGVVTAVKAGTATITATAGGYSATCVVTVEAKEEPEEPLTAGKYYKIKNVATGLYLQVSGNNTNMTLQEKSDAKLQIFTLEDAGEGKFYIKSTDADNCYYAHATTWNFNATTNANNKTPFTIALLNGETNIYTLYQNVTQNVGLAGTDSSNAGAFVFCDKRAENNGKWAFEVFTDEDRIAAAMAPLENAIANAESVLETRAQLLTNDEKKAISAAVQTAKDEKGKTNADVTAEIARLTALSEMVNNAVGDAIYVNAIDEISNAVCYTVSTESRGAWYSEASNLNSTGKLNIAYNITDNKQQFAFIKSPTTGNYYLYSVSEAKFVSKNGDYTTLTETPVQTITFLTGERTASYPWIIALNTADGEKQIAVSNTFEYGIITFYNDLTDAGNTVRLEKVATFDATAALALIDAYENGETAIEEVNVENVNVIIYDLQGRRVKEITEGGIYIINGKKVLVK